MNNTILKEKNAVYFRCAYGYMISGMTILILGAILPHLMEEGHFGYASAGGALSALAVGNFVSNLIYPFLSEKFGRKNLTGFLCALVTLYFPALSLVPPFPVIALLLFLLGITKGTITLFNTASINNMYDNPAPQLNMINCAYAAGAFAAPFLMALLMQLGFGWKTILYILSFLAATYSVNYFSISEKTLIKYQKQESAGRAAAGRTGSLPKTPKYFFLVLLLFFYVGLENSVNGWFVTYLRNAGIMRAELATFMVSVIWAVMMLSRLIWARISRKIQSPVILFINGIGLLSAVLLLNSSSDIRLIVPALILIGFCMACFFPVAAADAKTEMAGSATALAFMQAVSGFGGILTPFLIGQISEYFGMQTAMLLLSVNAFVIFLSAAANFRLYRKAAYKHAAGSRRPA